MFVGTWVMVQSRGPVISSSKNLPANPSHKPTYFFRGTYAAVPLDQLVVGLESLVKLSEPSLDCK